MPDCNLTSSLDQKRSNPQPAIHNNSSDQKMIFNDSGRVKIDFLKILLMCNALKMICIDSLLIRWDNYPNYSHPVLI